jgi:hypothetical protein
MSIVRTTNGDDFPRSSGACLGTRLIISLLNRTGCFHERLQPWLHQTSNRDRPPTAPRSAAAGVLPGVPEKHPCRSPASQSGGLTLAGVPVRFELGGRAADSERSLASLLAKAGHRAALQSNAARSGTVAQGGVAGSVSQPLRFLQPPWSRSSDLASVRRGAVPPGPVTRGAALHGTEKRRQQKRGLSQRDQNRAASNGCPLRSMW